MTADLLHKHPTACLIIIILIGALLRLWGVTSQPILDDEVGVAFTAVNYMENGQFGPTMWHHPNLRNLVIYLAGEPFGYNALTLRGMSLLTGILGIPLMWGIVKRIGGDNSTALLAAFLLAIEEVHITFSRQAIQETWTPFFFLAGIYLVLIYLQEGRRPVPLVLAGISFGAGCASKFHAAFPLLACLAYCIWFSFRERQWRRLVFELCALALVPFTLYLLTYLPWFARGYGLPDWFSMQQAIIHKMVTHQGNPMDQIIDRKAWQWFLRPMVYGSFVMAGETPHVTIAWSNPLVWLLVFPSMVHQMWQSWVRRKTDDVWGRLAPVALFIVCYLPLAASSRPIWLLTSLAVLPFAFMFLSRSLVEIACTVNKGNRYLAAYCILIGAVTVLTHPLATGKGMHYGYLAPIVKTYRSVMEPSPAVR